MIFHKVRDAELGANLRLLRKLSTKMHMLTQDAGQIEKAMLLQPLPTPRLSLDRALRDEMRSHTKPSLNKQCDSPDCPSRWLSLLFNNRTTDING